MAAYTKSSPGASDSGFYTAGDSVTDSLNNVFTCMITGFAGQTLNQWAAASTTVPVTATGVGAKAGSTVSVVEQGDAFIHKTTLTFTATPVTITDDAGVAQYGGTAKIYDFPEGLLLILGTVVTGTLTLGTTGTIIDTYTGVCSVGTITATTGATLVSTEADIMQSNAIGNAVAKVSAIDGVSKCTQLTESASTWLDGTATAKDAYLNFAIADDATHTSGTGTFTGTVVMTWINLGDN